MFEDTVKSATFPVIKELLEALGDGLDGVRHRFNAQMNTADAAGDRAGGLIAAQQLGMLNAWEPLLKDLRHSLEEEHQQPTRRQHP